MPESPRIPGLQHRRHHRADPGRQQFRQQSRHVETAADGLAHTGSHLSTAGTRAVPRRRTLRDATDLALAWAEKNIAFTRTGAGGRVQVPVRGLVAAAFDHWDSRAGDPHLHTHTVIANRAQTSDGTWRSLDGATLFRYTVALSELHEGVLQDLLTASLGIAWTTHPRRHSATPRWDIDGVPTGLLEEFSSRSRAIDAAKDDLVAAAIPWDRSLRRLAERRAGYFPAGADPVVVRRRPRSAIRQPS